MATIHTYETADIITDGLQGSDVCDEAITAARHAAKERGKPVVLDDDDGVWLVYPTGHAEACDREAWEADGCCISI